MSKRRTDWVRIWCLLRTCPEKGPPTRHHILEGTKYIIPYLNVTSLLAITVVWTDFVLIWIQTKKKMVWSCEMVLVLYLRWRAITGMSWPAPKSEPGQVLWEYSSVSPVTTKDCSRGKWEMLFYNESPRQRHTETCLFKKNLSLYILLVILQWEKHTKNSLFEEVQAVL